VRLKKLKITGFKSFADRVVLDFDASLIGVVGPNGCGKSNIVDAFRWVLGEQSAKSLRGTQMQDVLFAGSEKRHASSYAEVSITLGDIAEGELMLPYDEVTVTRRLDREGNSEYYINKQAALLRDVQQLFLGTGMGKSAFSIFEQGKIDRVIQLSPLARREIFDEAAGIGRFLERKKETMRKLSAMMENYHRLQDLHQEVDKNTRVLKKQALQAEQYVERQRRFEELDKGILTTKLQRLRTAKSQQDALLVALHQQGQGYEVDKTKQETIYSDLVAQRRECETRVAQALEAKTKAEKMLAVQESEERQQTKREEELTKRYQQLVVEKEHEQQQVVQYQKQLGEKQPLQPGDLEEQERQLKQLHLDLKQKQQEQMLAVQHLAKQQQAVQAAQFRLESMRTSQKRFQEELAQYTEREQTLVKLSEEQQSKVDALKASIEQAQHKLKASSMHQMQLQQLQKQLEQELASLGKKQAELQTAKTMLEKLRQTYEGASSGWQHLQQATQDPKHPLYQKLERLDQWIHPKKGQGKIVDHVLASYRQMWIVKTQEDKQKILGYASEHQLKDFSLLCLEGLKSGREKKNSLLEAVEANEVTCHLFCDLTSSDAQTPGTLSPEGYFVDHKGILFVQGDMENALFTQQERLVQITCELVEVQQQIVEKEQQLEQAKKDVLTVTTDKQQQEEQYRRQEMSLVQENFSLQRTLGDLKENKHKCVHVRSQEQALKIEPLSKELELLQQQVIEKGHHVEHAQEHVQRAEALWQEKQAELQTKRMLAHELSLLQAKLQEREKASSRVLQELEETQQACKACAQMLSSRRQHIEEAKKQLQDLQVQLKTATEHLHERRTQQEQLETSLRTLRQQLQQIQQKVHTCQLKQTQEVTLETQLTQELEQRYSIKDEAWIMSQSALSTLDEAEQELKNLRQVLAQTGTVNLTAIEMYAEQSQRFEDLDRQLKDLIQAKQDLEGLIAKLDHDSRKLFKQTFTQVRTHFQRNFQTLFGGGEADLAFTDSHDVLEAGVDIMARPPGKQMKAISLLSGGEKCLTALALLFALFEVKPAPFCILDEVDAPLDEANVTRFTKMLGHYVNSTQFILVTHNKKTMAVADVLIGVSMEEKGVSKLLSLAFAQQPVQV